MNKEALALLSVHRNINLLASAETFISSWIYDRILFVLNIFSKRHVIIFFLNENVK